MPARTAIMAPADSVGSAVTMLRAICSESRRDFASRAGLTEGAIRHIEAGRTEPSIGTLARLADVCGFDVVILLTRRADG